MFELITGVYNRPFLCRTLYT